MGRDARLNKADAEDKRRTTAYAVLDDCDKAAGALENILTRAIEVFSGEHTPTDRDDMARALGELRDRVQALRAKMGTVREAGRNAGDAS